jgi:hypothetical protein
MRTKNNRHVGEHLQSATLNLFRLTKRRPNTKTVEKAPKTTLTTRRAGKSDGGLMKLYTPSGETPAGKAQRSVGAAEEAILRRGAPVSQFVSR